MPVVYYLLMEGYKQKSPQFPKSFLRVNYIKITLYLNSKRNKLYTLDLLSPEHKNHVRIIVVVDLPIVVSQYHKTLMDLQISDIG